MKSQNYIRRLELFIAIAVGLLVGLTFLGLGDLMGEMVSPQGDTPSEFIAPTPEQTINILYQGKVSYYSHAGCIGCSPNQTMGNGQPFKELEYTLAVPCEDIISGLHKYNTVVKVINQDNQKQVEATITDCGGFSKYNRIADLSKGLYQYLGAKTDKINVVIYREEL